MFRVLLYIFETFRAYVVFFSLVLTSIFIMAINSNPNLRTLQSFAITGIGFVESILSFIPNPITLKFERDRLQLENIRLHEEVNTLRQSRLENGNLRNLLSLKEQTPFTIIPADVVGKNLHLLRNTITLNVGTSDGIHSNMAVITDEGLVGRITTASEHYSIAQILLHRDCRVSATVERSRVNGIIAWEGGVNIMLKNIVKSVDIKPGDRIVTSQFSSIYPPNIEIGIVVSVQHVPETIFQNVEIAPSVHFSQLEHVFVVTAVADSERIALEKSAGQ